MRFIYRFLDKDGNIIYVGKTSKTLQERFTGHNHLKDECYNLTVKREKIELETLSDMDIVERYFINTWKPKYNKQGVRPDYPTPVPFYDGLEWKEYEYKKRIRKTKPKKINPSMEIESKKMTNISPSTFIYSYGSIRAILDKKKYENYKIVIQCAEEQIEDEKTQIVKTTKLLASIAENSTKYYEFEKQCLIRHMELLEKWENNLKRNIELCKAENS